MERDDLVRDVYAHFGLAMYLAQVLEHGIVNAMIAAKLPFRQTVTRQDIDAFMERQFKKPLGKLLQELTRHITVRGDLERVLTEALAMRNRLAHHYFRERAGDFVTAARLPWNDRRTEGSSATSYACRAVARHGRSTDAQKLRSDRRDNSEGGGEVLLTSRRDGRGCCPVWVEVATAVWRRRGRQPRGAGHGAARRQDSSSNGGG